METLPITISKSNLNSAIEQLLQSFGKLNGNQIVHDIKFTDLGKDQVSMEVKIRKEQEGKLTSFSNG